MSKTKEQIIYFVDTETTGLDWRRHEIVSIGIVVARKLDNKLEVTDEVEYLIKPDRLESADPIALKINKYNDADWAGAMDKATVMDLLWTRLYVPTEGDYKSEINSVILGGHNVHFDLLFLAKLISDYDKTLTPRHVIDTYALARHLLVGDIRPESYSLRSLCQFYDITNDKPHTALADARASYEV